LFDGRLLERELERKTSFKEQIRMISGESYGGFLKWMVYKGTLLKWMIWGVPLFLETSILSNENFSHEVLETLFDKDSIFSDECNDPYQSTSFHGMGFIP